MIKTYKILKMLKHKEMYGQQVVKNSGYVKKGSVYTLLHRLQSKGLVTSKFVNTKKGEQGPSRKIYKITSKGKKLLSDLRKELLC